ncbi:MAG: hypothetical protein M4579_006589 [Chaenotheca gracillima]|nr:MAG: hypothetical protein M4579_006589 [Chaenotheca gracillima]
MSLLEEAKKLAAQFVYTPDDVRAGVKEFLREMGTAHSAPGIFLAVDLGGTNFRVCSVKLLGNTTFTLTQSKVPIPKELMVAKTAKELFVFLAKQIEAFLQKHHNEHFENHKQRRLTVSGKEGDKDEEILELGFTFSFPVIQEGISKGKLMRWTKGFDIPDAIGRDVCALLQEEIDNLNLPVRVAALVNDTVGTLMARSYTSPGKTGTLLGAIFGTGTNGAYVEKLDRIKKLTGNANASDYDSSTGEMILNTEWGSFDNPLSHLPNTVWDEALDKDSVNKGYHMFEKRISGMYLGEVLRRVIVDMIKDPNVQLFKDTDSSTNDIHSTTTIAEDSALYKQWGIDTSFLSVATADDSVGLKITRQALDRDLGVSAASAEDAEAVRELVVAIGRRSARLSAVAIAAIVISSGRLNTSSGATTKSAASIGEDAKNLNLAEAAKATAEKIQVSAAPLVDQAPLVSEDDIVDVGVDGSLVEFYPGFETMLRGALREIPEIGPVGEKKIRIGIAKDGSGVGAALIALVASKMNKASSKS